MMHKYIFLSAINKSCSKPAPEYKTLTRDPFDWSEMKQSTKESQYRVKPAVPKILNPVKVVGAVARHEGRAETIEGHVSL